MINEQVRDREVRVISSDGEQLGIMSSKEAMKLAREAELDLVKIAPNAKPPVCKIIDYGKYRYELARKEKEAKKKQKTIDVNSSKGILEDFAQQLSDIAVVDKQPKFEGRSMIMFLTEKR